jgi:hypothetical protein
MYYNPTYILLYFTLPYHTIRNFPPSLLPTLTPLPPSPVRHMAYTLLQLLQHLAVIDPDFTIQRHSELYLHVVYLPP